MIIEKRNSGAGCEQQGAALLMLMIAVLGLTSLLLLQVSSASYFRHSRDLETTNSLAAAKEALIAFSLNYADNYGHNTRGGTGRLPCPAESRFSSPRTTCGANEIGFLPAVWERSGKQMDIDHVERFLAQDLWYAVSADFRYNPSFNQLNPDTTNNLLSVGDGDDVVAVIIAPGAPLPGQNRSLAPQSVGSYLEGENSDADGVFSLSAGNDRVVTISVDELMPLIERRVLGYARDWLREYRAEYGHYPYAAYFSDPLAVCESGLTQGKLALSGGDCDGVSFGEYLSSVVPNSRPLNNTWFVNSDWPNFIYYQFTENCGSLSDPALCDGVDDPNSELSVNGDSVQLLLINGGRAIETVAAGGMQQRDTGSISMVSYLDTTEVLEADTEFVIPRPSNMSNDQYLAIPQ